MPSVLQLSTCLVDLFAQRVVRDDGAGHPLTDTEVALLTYLAARPGKVVSRGELLQEVWGYHPSVVSRAVDSTVKRLRRKLEADPGEPRHLRSVFGRGYRLDLANDTQVPANPRERLRATTTFFGRHAELARLATLLDAGTSLVTVIGPGGAGKTRFVQHFASDYSGIVHFVELAAAREARDAVEAVAAALGVSLEAEDVDPAAAVAQALPEVSLLVLDNTEQIAGDLAPTVGAWLAAIPALRVVATSREPLHLPGEVRLPLGALPTDDAAALFVDRAADVGDYELDAADPVVRRIVERLDGLPLAVELAAARTTLLAPRELADRLDDQLAVLAGPSAARDPRHATLRGAIAWSWDLLDASQRRALSQLAVFDAPFGVDAATAIVDLTGTPDARRVIDVLQALRDRSLLRRSPARPSRLQLYEAVRAFALEQLSEAERTAVEGRHSAFYLDLAEATADVAWSWAQLRPAVEELDHLWAVWHRATDPVTRAQAALALDPILAARGPVGRRAEVLATAADGLDDLPAGLAVAVRIALGSLEQRRGRTARAVAVLGRAAEDAIGDDDLHLDALVALGRAQLIGSPDLARATLERAQALAESLGDDARLGAVHTSAGHGAEMAGDLSVAEAHFRAARAACRAGRDRGGEAVARYNLAFIALQGGRHDEAEAEIDAAVAAYAALGDERAELMRGFRAVLDMDRGRLEAAERHAREAMAYGQRTGHRALQAEDAYVLGSVLHRAGDLDAAAAAYEDAIASYDATGMSRDAAGAHALRAAVAAENGNIGLAERHLATAREVADGGEPAQVVAACAVIVRAATDPAGALGARPDVAAVARRSVAVRGALAALDRVLARADTG